MIVNCFSIDNGHEHTWCNVFIEPVDIHGATLYVVGTCDPGEGIPKGQTLQELASTAETVTPFEKPISLEALCSYIRESVAAGTWATPFLISEALVEARAPQSAFEEGMFDAARGLHFNANPHPDGTDVAGQWDEGWLAGHDGRFDELEQ